MLREINQRRSGGVTVTRFWDDDSGLHVIEARDDDPDGESIRFTVAEDADPDHAYWHPYTTAGREAVAI